MASTIGQKLAAALLIGTFACALAACEEQGPAEELGEAIDDSAEDAVDAVEDATD
ncbi:MAG: hypothetical protein R3F54_16670 [Alphaproteobacteria bacterium]